MHSPMFFSKIQQTNRLLQPTLYFVRIVKKNKNKKRVTILKPNVLQLCLLPVQAIIQHICYRLREVLLISHRVVFLVSCLLLLLTLPRMNVGQRMMSPARAHRKRCAFARSHLQRSRPAEMSWNNPALLRIPHQDCNVSHNQVLGLICCEWKRSCGYSPFKTFT